MLRSDDAVYSTSGVELADNLHPLGLARLYKVVEDTIDEVFIEYARVAISLQVEFETFQLDAKFIGNVFYLYCTEVRLTRSRTDGRELRRDMLDGVIPVRMRIVECFDIAHGQ